MNRADRRRHNRAMKRAMRRGRPEDVTVTVICRHDDCGLPVDGVDLNDASDNLRAHYVERHDGQEPA